MNKPLESGRELRVGVRNMNCASCVSRVERGLGEQLGVARATVNLATETATVVLHPGTTEIAPRLDALDRAGYPAVREAVDCERMVRTAERDDLGWDLRLAVGLSAPLVLVAMGPMVLPALGEAMSRLAPDVLWRCVALLAVSDPIKAGSRHALEQLRELGLDAVLVTGDNHASASVVARELGISTTVADVRPDAKAAEVRRRQEAGHRVAFVGDGINDAPALAQADVGLAIGTGTDIAIEAGEVILMSGDPLGIAQAVRLARRTLRTIRRNFFWAYAYNVALIPLAAGILYPSLGWLLNPMLAAAAMSVSSLFVITNSLRLRRFPARRGSAEAVS